MSLRTRLLLTTLGVAVPMTVVLFFVAERYRLAAMEDSIDRFLSTELASGIIARCEADGGLRPPPPAGRDGGSRGGRGGGPRGAGSGPIELIAYTRTFELARRSPGPAFPDALKDAVTSTGRALGVFSHEQGRGLQLAVRITDTTGP